MISHRHTGSLQTPPWWLLMIFGLLLGLPQLARGQADVPETFPWRLSAYGTLGWVRDDDNRLAPVRELTQRPADGATTGTTGRLDSRLGVQVAYTHSADARAVVQFSVRDQVAASLSGSVELAFLGLRPMPDVEVRLGRVGYAPFLMSDHRNLGYAYPWVRPPREFYGWIPLYTVNGGDLTWQIFRDEAVWQLRLQSGSSRNTVPMGTEDYELRLSAAHTLSLSRESGPWRLKFGLSRLSMANDPSSTGVQALYGGLDQIAALGLGAISDEAAMLRRETRFSGQRLTYATLGAAYEDGDWLLQGEVGRSRSGNAISTSGLTAYLAAARHLGNFTPYAMYSMSRPERDVLRPVNDWSVLGPTAASLQDAAYSQMVNSTRIDLDTLTLGVRWDFRRHAALKLQWENARIRDQGYALWFRTTDVQTRASRVNLLSATLDFAF